jgi:hypothetical protein
MVRIFSLLALVLLAMTPAESVRAPQPGSQQYPLVKAKAAGSGFQGRFATGVRCSTLLQVETFLL